LPSAGVFAKPSLTCYLPAIPVAGIAGDQQAALFGQACLTDGTAKNTYGTGCFALLNTGASPVVSKRGLLTTVAWTIDQRTSYALEGSVFVRGCSVQWLRDGLGMIRNARGDAGARRIGAGHRGVYFVPAFVGLERRTGIRTPRGILVGLTRGTTRAHIAARRARGHRVSEPRRAGHDDRRGRPGHGALRIDGGASANDFLCQFQADTSTPTSFAPL
jgi:glycerol kinase